MGALLHFSVPPRTFPTPSSCKAPAAPLMQPLAEPRMPPPCRPMRPRVLQDVPGALGSLLPSKQRWPTDCHAGHPAPLPAVPGAHHALRGYPHAR